MTILILGPSAWLPGKAPSRLEDLRPFLPSGWLAPVEGALRPLDVRVALANKLTQGGAPAIVMEAEEPRDPPNSTAKFLDLVRKHWVKEYYVYWPFGGARAGLDIELGFLLFQMGRGELTGEHLTVFYEDDGDQRRAASLGFTLQGELGFSSFERDGRRTRYYPDLVGFGAIAVGWKNIGELLERVLGRAGVEL